MGTDHSLFMVLAKSRELKYCHRSIFTCHETVKFSKVPDKVCFNWSGMLVQRATHCNLPTEKKISPITMVIIILELAWIFEKLFLIFSKEGSKTALKTLIFRILRRQGARDGRYFAFGRGGIG